MMTTNALILAVILFCIGVVGLISRRNIFVLYMSIELLLNAINLGFIAGSRIHGQADGLVIAVMIMAIAAAEAAIFLAMIVVLFRKTRSVDARTYKTLAASKEEV